MTLKALGSYDIVDELGAGGMGIVYKALDQTLKRTVAIKVIQAGKSARSSHLDRFKREAAVIARLRHPNVITLYDYGEEEGTFYYTMEYLKAETVGELIEDAEGPLSKRHLSAIGEGVFSALEYIHSQGLVHRDVKPGNIMVAPNERVTLMDFGLVKAQDLEALTKAGAIGTPRYMSPEMLKAENVDGRSDIFQMGLVLYEIATGKPAFKGRDVYVLARSVLAETPKNPSKVGKGLSNYFDEFIANCLAKDPNDRYQTAEEALTDFRRVLKNAPPLKKPTNALSQSSDSKESELKKSSNLSVLATKLSTSTITRPMFFFRDTPWPVKLLLLLLTAGLIVFIGSFMSPQAGGYRSFSIKTIPDLDAVNIHWSSETPYRSAIFWKEDGKNDSSYVKAVGSNRATTSHNILLDGIEKGIGYKFKVVYPDGTTSLPYTVKPVLASDLEARRLPPLWSSLNNLSIIWESNLPCTASVTFDLNGELIDRTLSRKLTRRHTLKLENLTFHSVLKNLRLTIATKRHRRVITGKDIDGPSRALNKFLAIVDQFKAGPLVARTKRKMASLGEKGDSEKLIRSTVDRLKPFRYLKSFSPAIKGVFQMTDESSVDYKAPLFIALRKLSAFDSLLDRFNKPRVHKLPGLYKNFIEVSYEKVLPPNPAVKIFELGEMDSSFLPTLKEQRPKNIMTSTAFTVMQAKHSFKVHYQLKKGSNLSHFFQSASDRPKMVLRSRNLTPEYFVRVTFGRGFSLDFWNNQESLPPTMWGSLHGENYEQTKLFEKSINSICVSFPKSMLTQGQNTFKVELYMLPGLEALHYTQIFGLYLYEN